MRRKVTTSLKTFSGENHDKNTVETPLKKLLEDATSLKTGKETGKPSENLQWSGSTLKTERGRHLPKNKKSRAWNPTMVKVPNGQRRVRKPR